jgi:hypothetical protein
MQLVLNEPPSSSSKLVGEIHPMVSRMGTVRGFRSDIYFSTTNFLVLTNSVVRKRYKYTPAPTA